jgi:hypothetical protein
MRTWKPIANTKGYYSISIFGDVRRNIGGVKGACPGRILHCGFAGKGYVKVGLYVDCKRIEKYVHTLVLETFVGPRPSGYVANHKNGIKLDNCVKNLEWVTYGQNNKHAIDLGLREPVRGDKHPLYGVPASDSRHPMFGKSGERNPAAKLTQFQAEEIRRRRPNETLVALAKNFGVCRRTIMNISLGRSYSGLPIF